MANHDLDRLKRYVSGRGGELDRLPPIPKGTDSRLTKFLEDLVNTEKYQASAINLTLAQQKWPKLCSGPMPQSIRQYFTNLAPSKALATHTVSSVFANMENPEFCTSAAGEPRKSPFLSASDDPIDLDSELF